MDNCNDLTKEIWLSPDLQSELARINRKKTDRFWSELENEIYSELVDKTHPPKEEKNYPD